jgi:hypothetical protein
VESSCRGVATGAPSQDTTIHPTSLSAEADPYVPRFIGPLPAAASESDVVDAHYVPPLIPAMPSIIIRRAGPISIPDHISVSSSGLDSDDDKYNHDAPTTEPVPRPPVVQEGDVEEVPELDDYEEGKLRYRMEVLEEQIACQAVLPTEGRISEEEREVCMMSLVEAGEAIRRARSITPLPPGFKIN